MEFVSHFTEQIIVDTAHIPAKLITTLITLLVTIARAHSGEYFSDLLHVRFQNRNLGTSAINALLKVISSERRCFQLFNSDKEILKGLNLQRLV